MHLGRGIECSRGKREELFHLGIELGRGREQAIVARAGFGGDTVGHFALHHEYDGLEMTAESEQPEQDVRGDEVRQIADYTCRLGNVFEAGTRGTRFGAEDCVEVDGQHVAFDDFDIDGSCELHAQLGCQHTIQLDCDEPARAPGQ